MFLLFVVGNYWFQIANPQAIIVSLEAIAIILELNHLAIRCMIKLLKYVNLVKKSDNLST